VEKYCRAGQTTEDLMTHARFTVDTYGYKHTLRICKHFCSFTATMVTEMRLNVTLYVVHCLSFISDAQSTLHADAIKCQQLISTLTNKNTHCAGYFGHEFGSHHDSTNYLIISSTNVINIILLLINLQKYSFNQSHAMLPRNCIIC